MSSKSKYFGFLFVGKSCERVEQIRGKEGILKFLKEHLFAKSADDKTEIRITDSQKNRVIFQSIGGVDLHSELQCHGISLPELYQEIKAEMVKRVQGTDATADMPEWEKYYDSIGLSAEEVEMRRIAKQRSKAAKTVRDVAELLKGTYFDAVFSTEDGTRSWAYFDPEEFSAQPNKQLGGNLGWKADRLKRIMINPDALVKYIGSAEDRHGFVLLDPPDDLDDLKK